MMMTRTEPLSDELVSNLIGFGSSLCKASSGVFFWVDDDYAIIEPQLFSLAHDFVDDYQVRMAGIDPISVRRMTQDNRKIAMLCAELPRFSVSVSSSYHQYLNSFDLTDEVDLVFHHDSIPVACLTMFRGRSQPAFSTDMLDWEGLRRYFQVTVQAHWRVRTRNAARHLVSRYDLKPREIEVLQLLTTGAANADISEILGISLSTVKTHIVNIFDKMGVDSRAAAVSKANILQFA